MDPEQLLKEGLNQIGFSYTKGQIRAFLTFLSELKRWNRVYNLTALKTDEDIIIKHFLDSLLYLKAILNSELRTLNSELNICDVGTGAGFPGIPIKIIKPEIDITLIEPSKKKCAFLRHIIRVLKLNGVSVLNKGIESLGKNYEKTYDVIVSRATFKIKDFLKKACPYVKENGRLVLSKGPKFPEEVKKLKNQSAVREVMRLPLAIHIGRTTFQAQRNLLIFRCEKKSHIL